MTYNALRHLVAVSPRCRPHDRAHGHCCDEFARSQLLAARSPGRAGCPRSSRACRRPAGTGLDRRTFLSRSLGAALTVYGARGARRRGRSTRRSRAPRRPATHRVLVTIFAPGGWDALSLLYPSGDPHYRRLRPTLALEAGDGRRVLGATRGSTGIPRSRPLSNCTARASSTVFPAIGYTTPTSRTSPRATSGRSARSTRSRSTGWLGRLLDVIGDEDNAMQGLRSTTSLLPSLATARVPVATLTDPADYGFDSHNVWDVPGALLEDAIGRSAASRTPGTRS